MNRFLLILLLVITSQVNAQLSSVQSVNFKNLKDVEIRESGIGMAVGDQSNVIVTEDCGATWVDRSSSFIKTFGDQDLIGVALVSDEKAFAITSGALYETNDFGLTWKAIDGKDGRSMFNSPQGVYLGKGLKFGESKSFRYSYNEWKEFSVPNTVISAICFINDKVGYIGDYSGAVYKTNDGGTTWETFKNPDGMAIFHLSFSDEQNGFILCDNHENGLLRYLNGQFVDSWYFEKVYGKVQKAKYGKLMNKSFDIVFKENTGVLVGPGYATLGKTRRTGILATIDNGEKWFPITDETNERSLNAISQNGVIVGDMGLIMKVDFDKIVELGNTIDQLLSEQLKQREDQMEVAKLQRELEALNRDINVKKQQIDRTQMMVNKKIVYDKAVLVYDHLQKQMNSVEGVENQIRIAKQLIGFLEKVQKHLESNTKTLEKEIKKLTDPEEILKVF